MPFKYIVNAFKGALFFGAFGPPIGSLVVSCYLIVHYRFGTEYRLFRYALATLLTMPLLSFMFGLVPALAVGAVAGLVGERLRPWARHAAMGVLGGLAALCFLIHGSPYMRYGPGTTGIAFYFFVLPGCWGGAVTSAWFSHRLASRARKFKRASFDATLR